MARPQEFDTDTVLDRALQVFWIKGYDDASIQDLVEATGLNRGSLYNAFGDKAQLFAAVMERYRANSPARVLVTAPEDASPRQLIVDFLHTLVDRARQDADHKGCLLTNTAAGLYGCNDDMTAWVRDNFSKLEDAFTTIIERGQERREIAPHHKPRALARFFIATAQGINVMARAKPDQQTLQDILDSALAVLDTSPS